MINARGMRASGLPRVASISRVIYALGVTQTIVIRRVLWL